MLCRPRQIRQMASDGGVGVGVAMDRLFRSVSGGDDIKEFCLSESLFLISVETVSTFAMIKVSKNYLSLTYN